MEAEDYVLVEEEVRVGMLSWLNAKFGFAEVPKKVEECKPVNNQVFLNDIAQMEPILIPVLQQTKEYHPEEPQVKQEATVDKCRREVNRKKKGKNHKR